MLESKDGVFSPRTINISTGTIFRLLAVVLVIGFVYLIRDVIVMLFAALFLAALIDPFADFFERWRIPRGLAAVIVYVIGLSVLAGVFILIVPPLIEQMQTFLADFSPIINQATGGDVNYQQFFSSGSFSETLGSTLSTIRSAGVSQAVPQLLQIGSMAFGAVASTVVVFVLGFFLVAEKTALVRAAAFIAPAEYQPFISQLSVKLRERIGYWLRGQFILMFCIFCLAYIALSLLGIPYALLLALLAGLLEVIPFIGPIMAAVPAVILALAISPVHALLTAVLYMLIQTFEGNILVPKIMQKATGMNPIISLLAVLIGLRIGGVAGAFLSIPLTMALSVFLEEVFRARSTVAT